MEQRMLAAVLDELRFPARRWQIVTAAELFGVDNRTLMSLRQIPDAQYPDVAAVASAARHAAAARPRVVPA
ncbi:hypothetical protein Acsp06_65240 [Actinomycetospora sp. NBRC 106375]|uniref:DUF2795 domain-containing protein n=1 Tax=Actinomycetospora sp. NBRC 106375 TaxID=3032207 RepID=UPI0024A56722|nr:DUF2795 domain-containing protein [Actinomycetospora sp. NBRC 106375]GLZ50339.1 hypothetical protein Acsp06_65240 [Actinomycetospora sp. NBRC 106375]